MVREINMNRALYILLNFRRVLKHTKYFISKNYIELENECLRNDSDLMSILSLVKMYQYTNNLEKELHYISKFLESRIDVEFLERACSILFHQKKYDKAIKLLNKHLEHLRKKKVKRKFLGYLYSAHKLLKQYEEALSVLYIIKDLDPQEKNLEKRICSMEELIKKNGKHDRT